MWAVQVMRGPRGTNSALEGDLDELFHQRFDTSLLLTQGDTTEQLLTHTFVKSLFEDLDVFMLDGFSVE